MVFVRGGMITSRGSTLLAQRELCRFVSAVTGGDPVQPTLLPGKREGRVRWTAQGWYLRRFAWQTRFQPNDAPSLGQLAGKVPVNACF